MTRGMAKGETGNRKKRTKIGGGLLWTYGWGRSGPEVTGATAARGGPQVPTWKLWPREALTTPYSEALAKNWPRAQRHPLARASE